MEPDQLAKKLTSINLKLNSIKEYKNLSDTIDNFETETDEELLFKETLLWCEKELLYQTLLNDILKTYISQDDYQNILKILNNSINNKEKEYTKEDNVIFINFKK